LASYYDYSDECINSFSALASDLFYYHQNYTGKASTTANPRSNAWDYQMFNITGVIGGDLNNAIYYCYLFENSVELYTLQRWSTFVSIQDFYTSFLFNLLSQSL
jgi:hypothetical protein